MRQKQTQKLKITFIDNTNITMGKDQAKIEDYFFDSNNKTHKTELNVLKGAFHAITGQIEKLIQKILNLKLKNGNYWK